MTIPYDGLGSSSGSSDDEDDEDGGEPMTAKSFLKKDGAPETNKFLKDAKGSGVKRCKITQ